MNTPSADSMSTQKQMSSPVNDSRKGWRKALYIAGRPFVWMMLLPIWTYQHCISPFTPASCRFTPTCSQYAKEALIKYGPLKGTYLALRRLLRCHPWGGSGYDPIP